MKQEIRPRRALRTTLVLALLGLGAASVAGGCDADNALVGGACAAGYVECDHECVDVSRDPRHCGGCDRACAPGLACDQGACVAPDGALPDGAWDGSSDAPWDGESDAPWSDGGDGSALDGADVACIPPYDTDQHCGDCFTACTPENTCAPSDGGFACVPRCTPPLSFCAGACVDKNTDPLHCGSCTNVCLSNLCVAGECVGASTGNIVVIGHDYFSAVPSGGAQARVLSNAVFLASHNPLRVLSFEHYSNATAVSNVKAILSAAAATLGRTLTITVTTTDADIPSSLSPTSYDVLLVYDQQNAATGALSTLGTSWSATLSSFTKAGGSVVVLDGAAGTVQEMPAFTTSSGVLSTSAHASLTAGTAVRNAAPANVVGVGVLSPYGVADHSVHMTTEPSGGDVTYVIVDQNVDAGTGSGEPVVVHKVVP